MTTRVPHHMIGLQPSGGDDRAQILAALALGPVYLAPGNWLVLAARSACCLFNAKAWRNPS